MRYRVIPPQADAEFAANMEEVLETYERPNAAQQPVMCMDEQPVQLVKDTRESLPATENHPQRTDYEYERAGTAAVFMFCEPLSGWRQARARERSTKTDWAREVADLLEERYAGCGKVTLVLDNLNTHTKGPFSAAFEPERAPDWCPERAADADRGLVNRCERASGRSGMADED
ncbi:MAG: transposase [Bryobacterales bacterium]|nr:transposase [Bryobacterales bacterium]